MNNILAKIEANNAGVDDAIMLDIDGFVAETKYQISFRLDFRFNSFSNCSSTNIFIVDQNGVLLTPHADACLVIIIFGSFKLKIIIIDL